MPSPTLRQLQYAAAVARTGHFGRAAEACAVTQPALSQQIAALEAQCGTALFDRLSGGVRLTPFGQQFIDLAQEVLDSAERVATLIDTHAGRPNRPVRFGIIPTVAPYLLPHLFPALTAQMPDVAFAVSESRTEQLLDGLTDGSLDVALIATTPPAGGPKLTTATLFEDDFVLATPAGDGDREPVALAAVDTSRMLLLDEGHCFRDQALAACGLTADRTRTFAATSLSTIVEFVANGQGITLLPEIALRKETAGDRIAIHRLASPGAGRMLSLVWREATPFAALFEEIAAVIRRTHAV
ncbi:MAG: hydrogen peroxide-inducible genes activator [Devosia sp.]|uniref:hydrogen peroxide-inducible genes activator n=1 Tax=Devosia sp. TaxID=1871048 RepID=UPI001A51D18E|nr:hydrogen peroxide-inducible genes activator [Devosia sp.]MBL8597899.1 hydrogen peroxide-inducible genes activator [Devosia sp.]